MDNFPLSIPAYMKKIFRSLSMIINYKTFIVTILSLVSTYVCFHAGLTANFPDMLVGVAIVFPVVFSIGSAYQRRESALQRLADFKGHAVAIYYAARDWPGDKRGNLPEEAKELITKIFVKLRQLMVQKKNDFWETHEIELYELFSTLSRFTMKFREHGVYGGEVSRVSQYVSKMIIAYDYMKVIHNYRTPVTLRAYSKAFIYIFPIIYGPYFANAFNTYSYPLEYVMPILYSFILVSLDNIQDHLENPFDEIGEDDIQIDVGQTSKLLT